MKEGFDPIEYDKNSIKFVYEWDGHKLTLVDNEDMNRLNPLYRQKAAE
jgi:hypothetical protein